MKTNDQWLTEFHGKHGDKYNYSLMPDNVRSTMKFYVICHIHGAFNQSPTNHLRGSGCTECFRDRYRKTDSEKLKSRGLRETAYRVSGRRSEVTRKRYAESYEVRQDIIRRNTARYHRLKNSVDKKIEVLCRSLVQRVILASQGVKTMRTEECLGYSHEQFKNHIESQFEPWMSWENHGEWHVDHKKPLILFIREGVIDPAIINALSNLKPLSAIENLAKSDSYSGDVSR